MKGTQILLELSPHSPDNPYLDTDNIVWRNDLPTDKHHAAWCSPVPFQDSPPHPQYDSIEQLFSTVNPDAKYITPKLARNDVISIDGLLNNSIGITIYCNNWLRMLHITSRIKQYMKLLVYWMCVVCREGCIWQKYI